MKYVLRIKKYVFEKSNLFESINICCDSDSLPHTISKNQRIYFESANHLFIFIYLKKTKGICSTIFIIGENVKIECGLTYQKLKKKSNEFCE